jgi:3-methyladenine DNA glycosylase/8-oxoguanine DNA glycosylase
MMTAIDALKRADDRLAEAIAVIGPCRMVRGRGQPYEALLSAIAHQQLHGKAAAAIVARLKALSPVGRFPAPEQLLATPDPVLRATGLSQAKLRAMQEVARGVGEGLVPDRRAIQRLSDEEIIERLTQIRGVGRWTVEMILMFTLNRPDVLPVGDFGIREGFRLLYRKRRQPTPAVLARFGERWAPYRTVASWYLWRYVDHVRERARR